MGGLFPQFMRDGSEINELGVRQMAAVQLAFDRVNNKNDPMYGNLLPNKQVCAVNSCIVFACYNLDYTILLPLCAAQTASQRQQATNRSGHRSGRATHIRPAP